MNKEIIDRVEELVTRSAILSSRGRYDKKIDDELTALFSKDKEAYKIGYEKARESFGL